MENKELVVTPVVTTAQENYLKVARALQKLTALKSATQEYQFTLHSGDKRTTINVGDLPLEAVIETASQVFAYAENRAKALDYLGVDTPVRMGTKLIEDILKALRLRADFLTATENIKKLSDLKEKLYNALPAKDRRDLQILELTNDEDTQSLLAFAEKI